MGLWDKLFGRSNGIQSLELKSFADEPALSRLMMPKPPPLDISKERLLEYTRRSEIVYACIEKKAQAACDPELVVERKNSAGEWEPDPEHPLVALMNKPNPYDDGSSFLRAWIASENFANVFYAEMIRSGAGQPVQLYPLNPVNIREEYTYSSAGPILSHYVYQQDGYQVEFAPEELLIRRRHSLGSIFSNLSPVAIALGSIDADTALTDYVRGFFNNGGMPSAVINIKDRRLSDEQAEEMMARWQRTFGRNGSRRGGVAVLDNAQAEYQTVGAMLNELESDSVTSKIESRICMTFGVPPILIAAYVGLLHVNQRASAREAQEDFWMNTMSPELKALRQFLTWNLLSEFEDREAIRRGDVRVNWDMSQVDALQEDLDSIYKRSIDAYKGGILTLNESRERIGVDPVDSEEGDTFFKPPAPINGQGQPGDNEPPNEPKQLSAGIEHKHDDAIIEAEIIEPAPVEKKKVEIDGIEFARELTEIESLIGVKGIATDLKTFQERLTVLMSNLRNALIDEAAEIGPSLDADEIHKMILTPPATIWRKIIAVITAAFIGGRNQVVRELNAQGAGLDTTLEREVIGDVVESIADVTVARAVNEVQTRAINRLASFVTLGIVGLEIRERLRAELRDQSDKWVDGFASAAANASMQRGRITEMREQSDGIRVYEYSAVLDRLLCENCEPWDGIQAANVDDLPQTPNPECLGGDRCRCFIIAIHDTEAV